MKRDELPSYTLIRSARRSMAIEIKAGGEVLVRVPNRVSDQAARAFVAAYRDKLLAGIERMKHVGQAPLPDAQEAARLRKLAGDIMPAKVAHWCARLGVQAQRVSITSAQKRWGSCSSKGSICFSYLLMRCPMDFIDYVALHEVAHLKHRDHGRAFYALIEHHMPDYRQRQRLARQPVTGEEGA